MGIEPLPFRLRLRCVRSNEICSILPENADLEHKFYETGGKSEQNIDI
jgi:hypothetical protein